MVEDLGGFGRMILLMVLPFQLYRIISKNIATPLLCKKNKN